MEISTINSGKSSRKYVMALLALITAFAVFHLGIQHFALKSFNILQIEGSFPTGTQLYFDNSTPLHGISEQTRVGTTVKASPAFNSSTKPTPLRIHLSNRIVDRFQLTVVYPIEHDAELGHKLDVKHLTLLSHFSKQAVSWDTPSITSAFSITQTQDKKTNRPLTILELKQPLTANNIFLTWILPLVMAVGTTILLMTAQWPALPALDDLLSNQQSRNTQNFAALDGLRGLAAVFVLLEHTMGVFSGIGHLGVWLFFVLSGFLLMKPFVVQPEKMLQIKQLAHFMQRRIQRIIPMYFFMITGVFLLDLRIEDAMRHYLLVQGDGHYWSIVQEMYFYILLPVIAIVAYLLGRGRPILSSLLLLSAATVWSFSHTQSAFSIYAMNLPMQLFFEVFMIGTMGTYLFHAVFVKQPQLQAFFQRHCHSITLAAGVFLLFLVQLFMRNNAFGFQLVAFAQPLVSAVLCLILILLAVMLPTHSWYNRILANYSLRFIGIIGFSFYLIHPYVVTLVNYSVERLFRVPVDFFGDLPRFIVAMIITTFFASLTYSYIERPFLIKKRPA